MLLIIYELIILGLFCNGLSLAAEEGMILYKSKKWMEENMPVWIYKPVIGCVWCMASYWGIILHSILSYIQYHSLLHYCFTLPIIIVCGAFVNGLFTTIYNKLNVP